MSTDDDAMREFARALFHTTDADQAEADEAPPKLANVVPREGHNPSPRTNNADLRDFAAALFGRNY